jgi:ATP-binding cassette subfamily C protein CydC
VGYISQDSYIFALSILDNLRIGNVEISLDQAWHALDLVGLKSHVEALPQGIYSLASEAGLNFSGGEAQRLALARVFLQDPSIVVLDEPTVGLDPATEHSIMEAIMNVFADQTLIMITHHLQGIESFDRVIFLENGKLEMDGSPEDLAKKNTRFKKLLAFDSGFPGHLSKER